MGELRKQQVEQAREAGYPDDEIWGRLATMPDIQDALKQGASVEQVKTYVGLASEREAAEVGRQEKLTKLKPVFDTLKELAAGAVKPLKRLPEVYGEEVQAGGDLMSQALNDPSWKNILMGGMGAMQYGFAPLTAIAKTGGETLVRDPALAAGAPEGVANFLGQMGETGIDFALPGAIGGKISKNLPKMITPTEEGFSTAGMIYKRGSKEYPIKQALQDVYRKRFEPPPVMDDVAQIFRGDEKIISKGVAEYLVQDATTAATEALKGNFDNSRRIFHQIADHLKVGEIQIEDLPDILRKYNLTPEQFAEEYRNTISRAGRTLKYHSDVAKRLNKVFKDNPESLQALEEGMKQEKKYASDILFDMWAKIDQPRRAFLVTQLSTAMRNAFSQAGRITIGAFDDAMQTISGGGSTAEGVKDGLNTVTAFWHRLTPTGRQQVAKILESQGEGLGKARLLSQPVHEVTVGSKVANFLNIFNRSQEHFFRKMAFESKLRQQLGKQGLDFSTVNPKNIPGGMIEEATNYALEMTFAASAKGQLAKDFIRIWSKTPLTTINPFPRFAFANALPFILEHSPLGYLKAMSPNTLKELASGNSKAFSKAASRATIGTIMLESAWHLRQSKYAGDRWYELKIGDPDPKTGDQRIVDVRAYAPLSTYMFFAEAMIHPERIKGKDWAEAAIGLNRIAGSGLVLVDLLRAKKVESAQDILGRVVGAYIGSYTVPLRTPKDFISEVDKEEGVYRDTRLHPIIGPVMQNIPWVSQLLPEAVSPLTARRMTTESPILKQTTGFTDRIKRPIQSEIDKTGLDTSFVYPKTGVKEADYEMAKYMGPLVDKFAPSLILSNEKYINENLYGKRLILKAFFKMVRQQAKMELNTFNPELAQQISVEGMSDDEKKYIQTKLGIDLERLF